MMACRLHAGANRPYLDREPERLVVEGFRRWMAGYDTGDISCWELAWSYYADTLGAGDARRAVSALSCWVRIIRRGTTRSFCTFPYGCGRLCRDECLAVAMIANSQHGDEAALHYAATHLADEGQKQDLIDLIDAARSFADVLDDLGQRLLAVPKPVMADISNRPDRQQFH